MRRRNRLMRMALAVMMWMMLPGFASADDLDFLKPIWLNALENMQEQKYAGGERIVYEEPKVVSEAPELEVVRSGVYMNNEYESEAYVYAQVKNITEETIRISSIALTVYDANGKTLDKQEYASCVPTVIFSSIISPPQTSSASSVFPFDLSRVTVLNSLPRFADMKYEYEKQVNSISLSSFDRFPSLGLL